MIRDMTTFDLVKKVFEENPEIKKNNRFVISMVWAHEADRMKVGTRDEFLRLFSMGKFTGYEKILKAIGDVQEQFPELRTK